MVVSPATRYEGYSHVSQAISELGGKGASDPLLQNVNFFVLGVLVLGLAWALFRSGIATARGATLLAGLGFFSAIGSAFLPCDLGCGGTTTVGLLHNVFGVTGFVLAIAGMLMLGRHWRDDASWSGHARFSRMAVVVAIAAIAVFIVMRATDSEAYDGVAQRVFVTALLGWIFVTSVRRYRDLASPAETSDAATAG
jgi:hypothetical membrane protein